MKSFNKLKSIRAGNLTFTIREETSDLKAIKEVVINEAYKRKDFGIVAGENWIDIGANCGAFSVWAGAQGANVQAFEPDVDNAAIARANVDANRLSSRVKINDFGLSEREEGFTAALHRNSKNGNLWRNSLFRKWNGGDSVNVRIEPVKKYWTSENCIKLDAEGVEMPILEKYADVRVKKLVFEWSFDIDPSISRFEKVIAKLKAVYPKVHYVGYLNGYATWQPSWFPPSRTIWCY